MTLGLSLGLVPWVGAVPVLEENKPVHMTIRYFIHFQIWDKIESVTFSIQLQLRHNIDWMLINQLQSQNYEIGLRRTRLIKL